MLCYLRVSTQEQARSGLGLAAQREALTAAGQARDWDMRWLVDEGYSAGTLDRPALTEGFGLLRDGQADGLAVAKLDRLSRSMIDFAGVMEWSRAQRWSLVTLDLGVDTASPSGRLLANVFAAFAEFERELIRQRTRDALAEARARGQRLGRPRQYAADVVALVADLAHVRGMSHRGIAAHLNDAAVPTVGGGVWRHSTVRRLLNSHALDLAADAARERVASQSSSPAHRVKED
ncbi:recombinase family protein [Paractinoplanes ovalisporus]|nr:recombinase family protein [Actinoplanes ovalisporus]